MKKKKLKERNSELSQKNSSMLEDIYTLIDGKDFMKITEIKFRYNFHRDFIKMVTYGKCNNGLLPQCTMVSTPFSMTLNKTKPE